MLLPFLVSFSSKCFLSVLVKFEKLFTGSWCIYFMHGFGGVPWKSCACYGMISFPHMFLINCLLWTPVPPFACSGKIVIVAWSYLCVFLKCWVNALSIVNCITWIFLTWYILYPLIVLVCLLTWSDFKRLILTCDVIWARNCCVIVDQQGSLHYVGSLNCCWSEIVVDQPW